MTKDVDFYLSRIAELERKEKDFREYIKKYFDIQQFDLYAENERLKRGPCRFNCRTEKEAFVVGWLNAMQPTGSNTVEHERAMAEYAFKTWVKERE